MAIRPGDPVFTFDTWGVALNAPAASGVYALCNVNGLYLYFGETHDIRRRLADHLDDPHDGSRLKGATAFAYELWPTEDERVTKRNILVALYPTPRDEMLG